MKILHSACLLRPSMGILKQMEEEACAVKKIDINWTVKFFVPKGQNIKSNVILEARWTNSKYLHNILYKFFAWFMIRIEYYLWLLRQKDFDVILTRYSVHDIFQLIFLLISKSSVYLVHHTLEGPELNMNKTIIGRIRYFSEKIIGKLCIKYCYGIIGVTNEIIKYEIERGGRLNKINCLFPNGVNVTNYFEGVERPKSEIKKILFVASEFSEWHGLDLIFLDMRVNNYNFELHLVGKLLPEDYNYAVQDNRVILHGIKNRDFIEKLSTECHAALGSFALERKNMNEACTLKVREYLSLGLPVYSGHRDVFPIDFKFYVIGDPSVNSIINFSEKCSKFTRFRIINDSKKYIDKSYIVKSLFNQINDFN